MKRLISFLDRVMTPILILAYVAICIILLAITDTERGGALLLSMVWAGAVMALLRWGIWGILTLAYKTGRESQNAVKALVRTVEILQILLTGAAVATAIVFRSFPAVWLLIPTALFGLRGALRFDAEHFCK